jgi:TonB family protein
MVLPNGRPKLMDFGVARLDSAKVSAGEGYFGSPCYMAPEQIRSGDVTGRADLFSFGVVAYEALTGHRPFQGDSITAIVHSVVHDDPPPPRSYRPDLPPAFDAILARALAKDPERRYSSALAFVSALEAEAPSASGESVVGRGTVPLESGLHTIPAPPLAAEPKPEKRRPVRPMVVAAALGALAATLILLPRERPLKSGGGSIELRIETEPEGASIWVDGLDVGKSPLALPSVAPGPHLVRVAAEGYAPAELRLQTVAGMPTPPLRFVLAPTAALLAVRTNPPGATARLDGRKIGVTPLEAGFIKPGSHDLRIELKGYITQARQIVAEAGRPVLIELRLQEVPPPESAEEESSAKPAASAPLPLPPLVEGVLVPLDASVTPPRKISGDSASYPEAARRLKLEGSVTLELTVTEGGLARDVRVVESAGAVLDQAVVGAVEKWRFEPARKQGIKVRVRWKYRQTFRPAG